MMIKIHRLSTKQALHMLGGFALENYNPNSIGGHNHCYTARDKKRLIELFDGKPKWVHTEAKLLEIAQSLNRTVGAIKMQVYFMRKTGLIKFG